MKVLLLGASGQLGRSLQDRFSREWRLLAVDRTQLDIRDADAVMRAVARARPDLIVNAAAYNHVDQAEREATHTFAINATGPQYLAQAANDVGARLIHVSTDYVFGGRPAPVSYSEESPASPLNAYGRSKLQGERAVLVIQPTAIVVRTSWLYSEYGHNFVKTLVESGHKRREVVNDQIGCPTYAGDLAEAMLQLARLNAPGGIYHYCGATALSWYDFATRIRGLACLSGHLLPISSVRHGAAARRPRNSTLSCRKIQGYGIRIKPLDESLGPVLARIRHRDN